jgi:hypothetical protein
VLPVAAAEITPIEPDLVKASGGTAQPTESSIPAVSQSHAVLNRNEQDLAVLHIAAQLEHAVKKWEPVFRGKHALYR